MNKLIVAFVALAVCGVQARSGGPPGGCSTGSILPAGKHQREGRGNGGFKLCMESAGGNAYTINIDQSTARAKINGLRLRPVSSQGTFMQDFNTDILGDMNGEGRCIHHTTKLEKILPDQTSFTFMSAGGSRPTIEYYIVAGSRANYWTGTVGNC